VDPFQVLGIAPSFDVDLDAVARTHRDLSRALHPDRFVGAGPSERRAALGKAVEVNEAFRIVRDPIQRADALLRRSGVTVREEGGPPADPDFLMEMLERREALAEARRARDLAAVRVLAAAIDARERETEAALSAAFARPALDADAVQTKLAELRFYRRFLEEVSAIEDELAA